MIVVVAGNPDTIEALAGRRVEHAASTAGAADALESGTAEAVVVDEDGDGAARLIRRIRDGEFGNHRIPVVVAGDIRSEAPLLAFDQAIPRNDPEALEEAVELALAVADYQSVIERFYAECQQRADRGVTDPLEETQALQDLRDEADDRLTELLSDPEVVADLLWTPESAFDFGFGAGQNDSTLGS